MKPIVNFSFLISYFLFQFCFLLSPQILHADPFTLHKEAQSLSLYLSGHGCDDAKPWDFVVSDGMKAGKRAKIAVPSCWEQQGFGAYTYGRWYTQKDGKPSTETGTYTTDFRVPKDWQGRHVELCFEGVMTDATVWVNGQQAGETHRGAFTPFSYDVSALVKYGSKNQLKVLVAKESSDKSINAAERKADWWLFGGIYRPVYLSASPRTHIQRATVDARADGEVNIQLLVAGQTPCRLRGSIEGLGQQEVDVLADSSRVQMRFASPRLWDTEHPHLYDLDLELLDADGTVVHRLTKRIGFRTIEFRRHDGFYLNGTKLLVKGVNRHCFYPATGRTSSYERDLEDVLLIKRMNANAIRSHYPPDSHVLDICDSLGILYLDELPGWQNAYSTPQGQRILREMVVRDASHPCVFAWSNGNEGGFNYDLDPLFGSYDPQGRHVVHAWALWDGVDAHHYPAFQTGVDRLRYGQEVFLPTEFLHAQYDKGGGASLSDYWQLWQQSPLFAGGFIWAWADEGIERTDRRGAIDTDGPNGPDGLVGPYREREGSWYAVREVWSPVAIAPFTIRRPWNGRLHVENRQLFSSLSECRMTWEWLSPVSGEVLSQGAVSLPDAAPSESRIVQLPASMPDVPSILRLTAFSSAGDTLNIVTAPNFTAEEQFLKSQWRMEKDPTKSDLRATFTTRENWDILISPLGHSKGTLLCAFSRSTGLLTKVEANGREIAFNGGPVPIGFKAELKELSTRQEGSDALVVARYTGGIDSIVWRMKPDGILYMTAVLFNDRRGHGYRGSFIDEGQYNFGLSFSYPEEQCQGLRWLGKGPYRVWRNREQGQTFGLWQKDYNDAVTGELPEGASGPLQYPEFKGYHAHMMWAEIQSETSPVKIYSATDGVYLRMFTPKEPRHRRDGKATMTSFPSGDISFLVSIAPIQSYKPLTQLGPSAVPPTVRINPGDEGITLRLAFQFE